MAKSTELLDTSNHEIQALWMGLDELRQANYSLRVLTKGPEVPSCSTSIRVPKGYGTGGNT